MHFFDKYASYLDVRYLVPIYAKFISTLFDFIFTSVITIWHVMFFSLWFASTHGPTHTAACWCHLLIDISWVHRLSLQVFYLWRHLLATAPPFILWWSNLEILFCPLHRSSPFIGELLCKAIQTEQGPYIADRTQKAVYIVRFLCIYYTASCRHWLSPACLLPVCLPACLPAPSLAALPACLSAPSLAALPACLRPTYLPACLPL
jgi:hypothetical protein